jgi:hypothetical protein
VTDVDRTAASTSVTALARKVVSFELGVWRSLYRWATRRPRGPAGAETFGYAGPATPVIWAFIGLSAVEIPVAHLLLPWQTARVVVLLVGVWGLTWMFGFLASLKTYPHVVGDSGLRLRYGTAIDITIHGRRSRRSVSATATYPARGPSRSAAPTPARSSTSAYPARPTSMSHCATP